MEWHHHAKFDIHAWAAAVFGEPDVTECQIYYNSSQNDFLNFTHPQKFGIFMVNKLSSELEILEILYYIFVSSGQAENALDILLKIGQFLRAKKYSMLYIIGLASKILLKKWVVS